MVCVAAWMISHCAWQDTVLLATFSARQPRRLAMIVCCAVQWPSSHLRIFGSWLKFEARFVNRKKLMARLSTTSWWLVAVVFVPLFKTLKKLEWRPRSETRWLGLNFFGHFLFLPPVVELMRQLRSWPLGRKFGLFLFDFCRICILF